MKRGRDAGHAHGTVQTRTAQPRLRDKRSLAGARGPVTLPQILQRLGQGLLFHPAVAMHGIAREDELVPMVARPSGSLVSLTLASFSTRGSTSFSTNSAYRPDIVSYSRPRSLPWASPLPLAIEIATITGTRFWAIRLSSTVKSRRSG